MDPKKHRLLQGVLKNDPEDFKIKWRAEMKKKNDEKAKKEVFGKAGSFFKHGVATQDKCQVILEDVVLEEKDLSKPQVTPGEFSNDDEAVMPQDNLQIKFLSKTALKEAIAKAFTAPRNDRKQSVHNSVCIGEDDVQNDVGESIFSEDVQ